MSAIAFDLDGAPLPVLDDSASASSPGEFVALLGPSGCGKSTLLRLVAGLEPPTPGTLRADGEPITGPYPVARRGVPGPDPVSLAHRRGTMSRSAWRRGASCKPARSASMRRCSWSGLTDFANAYPHQLSGGMAQRVALARALVNDPDLLLLDEPLGQARFADAASPCRANWSSLWQRTGFTALLVTHDVEEALFMAKRVIVLSDAPGRDQGRHRHRPPYPRHRDDPDLVGARREILGLLGLDASW